MESAYAKQLFLKYLNRIDIKREGSIVILTLELDFGDEKLAREYVEAIKKEYG